MRIALGVEYCGARFQGWQRQLHAPTIQASLEAALSKVANFPIETFCAGRTDAGVHACEQVVHFDCPHPRELKAWVLGTNSLLDPDIRVRWASPVEDTFHARFSAKARRYVYLILNRRVRSALYHQRISWYRDPLDHTLMHTAAQALIGEHDFSSFRAVTCQSPHARREVQHLRVTKNADIITIDIQANAFLHHMVRNIVGSLVKVGKTEKDPAWIAELLAARNRNLAAPTAPPDGLYLFQVIYMPGFSLPSEESQPIIAPLFY